MRKHPNVSGIFLPFFGKSLDLKTSTHGHMDILLFKCVRSADFCLHVRSLEHSELQSSFMYVCAQVYACVCVAVWHFKSEYLSHVCMWKSEDSFGYLFSLAIFSKRWSLSVQHRLSWVTQSLAPGDFPFLCSFSHCRRTGVMCMTLGFYSGLGMATLLLTLAQQEPHCCEMSLYIHVAFVG